MSTTKNPASNSPDFVPVSGICPQSEHFDMNLFASAGLSATEWRRLDPQIRLLAENAYSALEKSGYLQKRREMRIGCK